MVRETGRSEKANIRFWADFFFTTDLASPPFRAKMALPAGGNHDHQRPSLRDLVADSVHDWYEQALVETVIGLQALKGSREWSTKQIEAALSEEALTAVVMQRYHPYNSVKRELGTKIAPLKK